MNYNTGYSKLIIPEYGRNVQKLIEHARTIESTEYRQAFVEKIVNLIVQMHPQTRNIEDYRNKVWSHVFMIADYELNVDAPCEIINYKVEKKRPETVPYPQSKHRHRHYGRNVHNMIAKAIEMEDPEKKKAFTEIIGSYMKMAYKTWNRENVSDDIIRVDLTNMSEGKLELHEDAVLDGIFPSSSNNDRNDRNSNYKRRNSGSRSGQNNKGSNGRYKGKGNYNNKRKKR